MVGAGLAGLSAAIRLAAAGCDVHVLEAGEHAGGRLATERIDGFVVDRGFQVLNTGYPRAADLDLDALDLGWFERGAVVRHEGRVHRVVDPRQRPGRVLDTLTAPLGGPLQKAAIAAFSARAGYLPVARLLRGPERTADEALRAAGVGDAAMERFFRPFLAGVLLESELSTSSRYLDLLWRSFVRGAIGLPAEGMQAVGEQLGVAAAVRTAAPRGPGAPAWPRAWSPPTPGPGVPTPSSSPPTRAPPPHSSRPSTADAPRQVTTHLHVLPESPWDAPLIVLGRAGRPAGQHRRRLRRAARGTAPTPGRWSRAPRWRRTAEGDVRDEIARAHGVPATALEHLTTVTVTGAQPAADPPLVLRRPVELGDGLYVCGDHRDTPSIQGAMASGARAARAVLRSLRPTAQRPGAA